MTTLELTPTAASGATLGEAATTAAGACCGAAEASAALEPARAEQLASMFKALADPTRVRLLSLVAASAEGEVCVCDLVDAVDLSQPTVSHHLRILTEAGFLQRARRGTWAYYSIAPGSLERVAPGLLLAS